MIPRLTAGGASFQGAALYYLADKREPGEDVRTTDARVAWTHTLNLPTDDPQRAWRMMAHTAMSQATLKQAAGVKATGRKLAKPVMAYSLAWSPDEPAPDKAEMIEAARSSLAALGLEQHQALIVCHNDTAHPHVHVIVNRVSPANGIAHKGSKAKLVLSAWAEAYERDQGRILCVERVENNAARREKQKPVRKPKVSRNHWEAAQADPVRAARIAATYAEAFADLTAAERESGERRQIEHARLAARRKAGREAIRARYQAAVDHAGRPGLAADHARLADSLLQADPALGLATLTQHHSTFTRADIVRHIGRHTASVEAFQAVLSRLESSPELVAVGRDERGRQRFTTREHQAVERRMVDRAIRLQSSHRQPVRPLWPRKLAPSQDQDKALRHVVGPERLALVVGIAGTGKSTTMGAARRSWEAAGLQVRGMALSGIAADSLKAGSGINSQTVHKTLAQWGEGKNLPTRKDVLVVDEAGMIGSRQLERILQHAEDAGAKVVLIGDPEQLQAIEAGGAFRALAERFEPASIDTVRRQRVDWQQEATRELATANTDLAIGRYEQAGMVHRHDTQVQAKAAVIRSWRAAAVEQPGASQIILAFTRADVRDLNARARAVRQEAGELGPDRTLDTAAGKREFAAGDRIYFLKNDSGLGVRNGTLATIVRIERQTVIAKLDGEDGRQVMFGMANYNHIDHGYAATIHKSQGVTVDRAHLLASRNLDRHSTYVAMSRHRDRVDLHWSGEAFGNRNTMLRRLSRIAVKDTSLDYEAAEPGERASKPRRTPAPAKPARAMERERTKPSQKVAAPQREAPARQVRPDPRHDPLPEPRYPDRRDQPVKPEAAKPAHAGQEGRPSLPPDSHTERAARITGILDGLRRRIRGTFAPAAPPPPAAAPPPPRPAIPAPAAAPDQAGMSAVRRLWQERHQTQSKADAPAASAPLVPPAADRPSEPPAPPGFAAVNRLWREREEARQQQRDAATIRRATDALPPLQLEGPRPSDPQPVAITVTFELMTYDRETAVELQALHARHDAELTAEAIERATLRADAGADWEAFVAEDEPEDVALSEPDEPDVPDEPVQPWARGPKL